MNRYEQLKKEFEKFDQQNPKVWKLFVKFALDRANHGFKVYSVNAIFERVRWAMDETGHKKYRVSLPNNHRSFYARKFMEEYPEQEGFFRTAVQSSKFKKAK